MPAPKDRIHKRKDGRYEGRYTVQTPDGPKRKRVYGRRYKEVQRKLAEAMGDAARGLVFDAEQQTVAEYLNRWLSDSVRDTVRRSTFVRYESIVRYHINPTLGRLKLGRLTSHHVRALYRQKLDDELAPRSVQYIHTTLKKALRQAVLDTLVPRNVCDAVKPPRSTGRRLRPSPLPKSRRCSRPPLATVWKPSTCWPCTPGSGKASCWA